MPEFKNAGVIYHRDTNLAQYYACTFGGITDLANAMMSTNWLDGLSRTFEDPTKNILSVRLYPFDVPLAVTGGAETAPPTTAMVAGTAELKYGTDLYAKGYKINQTSIIQGVCTFVGLDKVMPGFSDITFWPRQLARYTLHVPFCGELDIPISALWYNDDAPYRDSIRVKYTISLASGTMTAVVMAYTHDPEYPDTHGNKLYIGTLRGKPSVDIPIGSGNATEIAQTLVKNVTQGASSLVSAMSGIPPTLSFPDIRAREYTAERDSGEITAFFDVPETPYITVTMPWLRDVMGEYVDRDGYRHLKGAPTNKVMRVGDIYGFAAISDIKLDHKALGMTLEEYDMLRSQLAAGVYFKDGPPPDEA